MAFEAMESLFDLDEQTTEEMFTNTMVPYEGTQGNVDHNHGVGGLAEMMQSFASNGNTGDGKPSFPYCVDVCAMREVSLVWSNLSHAVVELQNSVSVLETYIMVMTTAITSVALIGLSLLIYYLRKSVHDNGWITSSSTPAGGIVSITVPPSTASSSSGGTVTMKRLETSPPPSRHGLSSPESRPATSVPWPSSTWINVDKDGPVTRPATSQQNRGMTPMPLEIHEDSLDEQPQAMPGTSDNSYLTANRALRRPSWAPLGPRVLKPLEDLAPRNIIA